MAAIDGGLRYPPSPASIAVPAGSTSFASPAGLTLASLLTAMQNDCTELYADTDEWARWIIPALYDVERGNRIAPTTKPKHYTQASSHFAESQQLTI